MLNLIQPKSPKELKAIIEKAIQIHGCRADLNFIDVSEITTMNELFVGTLSLFNGDISKWDVSNVESMDFMFAGSDFNGKIGEWDVSGVKSMKYMFYRSKFNQDLSHWNVSQVQQFKGMFFESDFAGDVLHWKMVENLCNSKKLYMFAGSGWSKELNISDPTFERVQSACQEKFLAKQWLVEFWKANGDPSVDPTKASMKKVRL